MLPIAASMSQSSCTIHDTSSVQFDAVFDQYFVDRVASTIKRFDLMKSSMRVFVAYSGGKDSTVLLHVLKRLGYSVEGITVNAYIGCYSKENVKNATAICDSLSLPLHHISFRAEFGYSLCYLKSILQSKGHKYTSCSICGVLRRYLLNKHSRNMGADVIAFGHNMDDESQVILMNLIKGNPGLLGRLGPRSGQKTSPLFVPRVKPLYLVSEEEVIRYSKMHNFPVSYGECPCSVESLRYQVRSFPMTTERKLSIIESFLALRPKIAEDCENAGEIIQCVKCGEPTQQQVCKACEFLQKARGPSNN